MVLLIWAKGKGKGKGKGKIPLGCISAEPVTYVTRFSMPLSSALSQLHILVARLLPTPGIIYLRCAH